MTNAFTYIASKIACTLVLHNDGTATFTCPVDSSAGLVTKPNKDQSLSDAGILSLKRSQGGVNMTVDSKLYIAYLEAEVSKEPIDSSRSFKAVFRSKNSDDKPQWNNLLENRLNRDKDEAWRRIAYKHDVTVEHAKDKLEMTHFVRIYNPSNTGISKVETWGSLYLTVIGIFNKQLSISN